MKAILFLAKLRVRRLARHDAENDRRSSGESALEISVDCILREYENRRNSLISMWKVKKLLPVYRKLKNKYEIIMKDHEALEQHQTTKKRRQCENEIRQNEIDRERLETLRKEINNYESEEFSLQKINEMLEKNSEKRKTLLIEHKNLLDQEKKEKEPLNQKLTSDCTNWRKLDNKWQRRESYFDNKLEGLRAKYTEEYDYYRQCYKTYQPRRLEAKSFGEQCKILGIDTVDAKTVLKEENGSIKAWRQDVAQFLNQ